jgi:predicted SnoaL-like aldol condensation-catalyzing enzyme
MSPKEMAVSFLQMAGGGNVREAYEKFIAPDFIHHNQYFKGDRESLMLAMEEASRKSPNKSIDVKHAYQDEETVITHSQVTRKNPSEPAIAVVHIFRFKDGRVAELWDVAQPMINDSPNEHGTF